MIELPALQSIKQGDVLIRNHAWFWVVLGSSDTSICVLKIHDIQEPKKLWWTDDNWEQLRTDGMMIIDFITDPKTCKNMVFEKIFRK
jgi:hypothetical protein